MSILIKGMEMPKVSGVYSLDLYVGKICQVQNLDGATFEAIEIQPHGRLIDADNVSEQIFDLLRFPSNLANAQWFVNTIREMPTIIEAEDGE